MSHAHSLERNGLETKDQQAVDQKVVDAIAGEVKSIGENYKKLQESMQTDLAAARKLAEDTKSALDPLVREQIAKLSESVMAKIDATKAQLDEIEKKAGRFRAAANEIDVKELERALTFKRMSLARRGQLHATTIVEATDADMEALRAYEKSFVGYLRKGTHGEGGFIEAKDMSVGSDPDGGYWVTPTMSSRLLQIVYETSPMRELATVETIGTDALELPVDEGQAAAGWIGEQEARTGNTTSPQIGVQKIVANEMYARPQATQKLLEDASIDIGAWLEGKLAEIFARTEATAFVTGNGVARPRGFTTYTTGTGGRASAQIEQVASGAATSVTFDGLINLVSSLKEPYHPNATFVMRRATEGTLLTLKDGQGQYLWRPSLVQGKPNTLLGSPVRQFADLAALSASSLSVAFGDFRRGYTIVDRLGITVLRDPYSNKPFVQFYARKRVGGDVTNFEAIKLLVTSA